MKLPGRWWWLGAIALIALVGGGWWLIGRNREPRYGGRTVEQWFKAYYAQTDQGESADALRALRTNGLPYLVGVAFNTNQDSAARMNFYKLLSKLPDSWPKPRFISSDEIRSASVEAVYVIQPSGQELMPLIQDALEQTNSPRHVRALYLLGCVTNEQEVVVSHLLNAMHETNPVAQRAVYYYADRMGTNMGVVNLVRIFRESQPGSRTWSFAAKVIAEMNSNAIVAAPVMETDFENETSWQNRALLAMCLCRIEPEKPDALEYLDGLLTNSPSNRQIESVAYYLRDAGPIAKASVPALFSTLNTTNCDEQAVPVVTGTLRQLGASEQSILDVLMRRLENGSLKAHDEILEEMSANTERILDGIITNHSDNELWAVRLLAIRGTVVSAPVLKLELNSTNKDISNAAAYSMQMVTHR